ncbi:MAG: hypothetical protein HN404_17395 [Gemmatimonadetes bacterium]|nr:hypothetical protein [Gemmatimonadota bacterium]
MVNTRWFLPFRTLLGLALLVQGCGRQMEISPQSDLDTASFHYGQGMRSLEEGDLWNAQSSFERARGLDESFPGVAVGMALVASTQGEFFRAHKLLEGALHKDDSFVDAHVAQARVLAAEGVARDRSNDEWIDRARRSLHEAARLAPGNGAVPYRLAEIEFQVGNHEGARHALQRAMSLADTPWDTRATLLLTRLQTIERVSPVSSLGGKIALGEAITRAELAVLLIEELQIGELLAARQRLMGQAPAKVADIDAEGLGIAMNWARPAIERLLPLGIVGLEPLPDGSFAPDTPVTRAQLAMVADGLLQRLSGSAPSSDRYTGENSRFSDIDSDHYAYAAVASVVDRGMMAPDVISTRFRPGDAVDGARAIDVLRQLQTALRPGF